MSTGEEGNFQTKAENIILSRMQLSSAELFQRACERTRKSSKKGGGKLVKINLLNYIIKKPSFRRVFCENP